MNNNSRFDADVGIIGFGPTGVAAANFLGALGVNVLVVEREPDIYSRARAVTINDWTMRLFQSIGLSDELKNNMDATHSLRWITYEGQELMSMRFPSGNLGHATSYSIYQPEMEKTLREGASRFDNVKVEYGYEFEAIDQNFEGATIRLKDLNIGVSETRRVRYLLACDGGSSVTRENLGIGLIGDTLPTRWVVIDTKVKRWWPNRHVLTFWSDSKRPVVDIALAMGNHRWELPLNANETDDDFRTPAQVWRLLNSLGVTERDVEIHGHAFYNHHIRHAERWREGRVFLLGDAAHLMPPWAGSGMQSGIRDAHNISWKLAGVLAGKLPESILDSYEIERGPDVEKYTQISIGLGQIIKRELTDAQIQAVMREEMADSEVPPLLRPPVITEGWIQNDGRSEGIVGKLMPQPRAASCDGKFDLIDGLLGDGIVVMGLGIDPRTELSEDQEKAWESLGARFVTLRSADKKAESTDDLIDVDEELVNWIAGHGVNVIVVRHDKFVMAASGNMNVPN